MQNEVRLNVKLSAELLERVKVVAEKKQLTVSALTRLLLVNYVESYENEERLRQSKSETD